MGTIEKMILSVIVTIIGGLIALVAFPIGAVVIVGGCVAIQCINEN